MALVKCPECGTNSISDTAAACPKCGCAVKAHYDHVRYNQQMEDYKRQRAPYVQMPPKPKRNIAGIIGYSFMLVFAIFIIAFAVGAAASDYIAMFIIFMIVGLLMATVGFICLNNDYSKTKQARLLYNYAINHKEEYINSVLENEIKQAQTAAVFRCPVCGSNQIWKIGTADRMAGVFVAGIASSSIGKQYQCKKCGHKW